MGGERRADAHPAQPKETIDLAEAQALLVAIERAIARGKISLRPLAQAVHVEVAIAVAERECDTKTNTAGADPLFRLSLRGWAMAKSDLSALVPIREPHLRVLQFDYDVSEFRNAKSVMDFPRTASPRASAIVVFGQSGNARRDPLLVDSATVRILELSDGTRSVAEIACHIGHQHGGSAAQDELEWIENLFLCDFVRLHHGHVDASSDQDVKLTRVNKSLCVE
jgi:hypothetical protein